MNAEGEKRGRRENNELKLTEKEKKEKKKNGYEYKEKKNVCNKERSNIFFHKMTLLI